MDPTLTLSLSVNCRLSDNDRYQTYVLPLASITMPLRRWRKIKQETQTLIGDIRHFVSTTTAIGIIIFKSVAWGVGVL